MSAARRKGDKMSDIYHQTVKGIYRYPQINGFISVRNYMFAWQDDKRCLLLRFVNNFDQVIDSFEFTVTQLDVHGNVIKSLPIKYKKLGFRPGALYSSNKGIVVDDACADFKISFDKVRSGDYTYRVVDNKVVAYYPQPEKKLLDDDEVQTGSGIYSFREERRRIGVPRLAYLIALLTLGAVILLNVAYFIVQYFDIDLVEIIEDLFDLIGDMFDDIFG